MTKNNQKKEKALRNQENARKYRKKTVPFGRGRFGGGGGGRPGGPGAGSAAGPSQEAP